MKGEEKALNIDFKTASRINLLNLPLESTEDGTDDLNLQEGGIIPFDKLIAGSVLRPKLTSE